MSKILVVIILLLSCMRVAQAEKVSREQSEETAGACGVLLPHTGHNHSS